MTVPDPGLAIERTALAWRRTGLAHVVSAAIVLRLLDGSAIGWAAAAVLVAAAATATWSRIPAPRRILAVTAATATVSLLAVVGGLTA